MVLTSTLSIVYHDCSSIIICHVVDGDMAPGSCVKRGEGEGCYAAHLDVASCLSMSCPELHTRRRQTMTESHRSLFGCHVADSDVAPGFRIEQMIAGGR